MDVFRVFDSLNYVDNLNWASMLSVAGGVVECAIGYSGDRTDYNSKATGVLLDPSRQLQESGIHVLAIKDMAGLLKPLLLPNSSATREFPTSQSTSTRTTPPEQVSLLI